MLLSRTAKYLALHVNSPLGLPSQAKIPFIQNINLQTECFFFLSLRTIKGYCGKATSNCLKLAFPNFRKFVAANKENTGYLVIYDSITQ